MFCSDISFLFSHSKRLLTVILIYLLGGHSFRLLNLPYSVSAYLLKPQCSSSTPVAPLLYSPSPSYLHLLQSFLILTVQITFYIHRNSSLNNHISQNESLLLLNNNSMYYWPKHIAFSYKILKNRLEKVCFMNRQARVQISNLLSRSVVIWRNLIYVTEP